MLGTRWELWTLPAVKGAGLDGRAVQGNDIQLSECLGLPWETWGKTGQVEQDVQAWRWKGSLLTTIGRSVVWLWGWNRRMDRLKVKIARPWSWPVTLTTLLAANVLLWLGVEVGESCPRFWILTDGTYNSHRPRKPSYLLPTHSSESHLRFLFSQAQYFVGKNKTKHRNRTLLFSWYCLPSKAQRCQGTWWVWWFERKQPP